MVVLMMVNFISVMDLVVQMRTNVNLDLVMVTIPSLVTFTSMNEVKMLMII
jgi:hypothetical protein